MIARFWSAQTTPDRAQDYLNHLKTRVLPVLEKIDGYEGALLLEREEAGAVEVIVITKWISLEAIRGFAGEHLEGAVVAPEAAALLTGYDRRVRHYDLVINND